MVDVDDVDFGYAMDNVAIDRHLQYRSVCGFFFVCVETMNGNRITILSIDNVNFTSLLFICI